MMTMIDLVHIRAALRAVEMVAVVTVAAVPATAVVIPAGTSTQTRRRTLRNLNRVFYRGDGRHARRIFVL